MSDFRLIVFDIFIKRGNGQSLNGCNTETRSNISARRAKALLCALRVEIFLSAEPQTRIYRVGTG
jgi:hypothetical protein